MQSTSAAIAAAAISGADLGARANSSKGSSAATVGSNGFDASEAEAWMQARWKSVQTSLTDKKIPDTRQRYTRPHRALVALRGARTRVSQALLQALCDEAHADDEPLDVAGRTQRPSTRGSPTTLSRHPPQQRRSDASGWQACPSQRNTLLPTERVCVTAATAAGARLIRTRPHSLKQRESGGIASPPDPPPPPPPPPSSPSKLRRTSSGSAGQVAAMLASSSQRAWPQASPSHDDYDQALTVLRIVQPAAILAIALASVLIKPSKKWLAHLLHPRRSGYDQLRAEAHREHDDDDEPPQPTPVVVPVRSRRRFLTQSTQLGLAATFFASGVLIILRAVLPPKEWQPDLALWGAIDLQALGGLLAWGAIVIAALWEEKVRGRGSYGRGKSGWSLLAGAATDICLLVLYMIPKQRRDLPNTSRWSIAQLGLIILRLLLLYPVLILALSWDRVRFVRAADLANETGVGSAPGPSTSPARSAPANAESAGLLQAPGASATPSYGATGSSVNGANGKDSAKKNSAGNSGTQTPNRDPNASMGLSVATAPPPPTFSTFLYRIRFLFPYLWPSKSAHLQLIAVACVGLLFSARVVNFFTPLALGKLVEDLSQGASPWADVAIYAFLKMLQGQGSLLTVMQNVLWVPVEQYSDRMMSMMAFEHLLNLSMSFHTKKKTGEVLRILDRGSAINNFFQYLLFNLLPVFIDIFVAMIYMTRTFSPAIGIALFVVMVAYTWTSVQLTTWRTGLRRAMNNKDSICRAISADVLMNWETVKCYSNEGYEAERFRSALQDYQKAEFKVIGSLNMLNMVQNLILAFGTLFTIMLVAGSVVRGETTSSQFVVFVTYLQQVYQPLSMLGTLYRVVQQNLVDTDKLMTLLEEKTEVKDVPGAKDLVVTDGVIEFQDVRFSYDGKVEALKGLSFKIDRHSSVALVGESGAGKSSVGSHAELIAKKGAYSKMWEQQIKTQKEQEAAAAAQEASRQADQDAQPTEAAKPSAAAVTVEQDEQDEPAEAQPGMLGIVPPAVTGEPENPLEGAGENVEPADGAQGQGAAEGGDVEAPSQTEVQAAAELAKSTQPGSDAGANGNQGGLTVESTTATNGDASGASSPSLQDDSPSGSDLASSGTLSKDDKKKQQNRKKNAKRREKERQKKSSG
ncbi:hypothetical protein L1887_53359 [Cichorium endivia]|nr:hypothetical protein L1887_53359 [Cichorium endivia]